MALCIARSLLKLGALKSFETNKPWCQTSDANYKRMLKAANISEGYMVLWVASPWSWWCHNHNVMPDWLRSIIPWIMQKKGQLNQEWAWRGGEMIPIVAKLRRNNLDKYIICYSLVYSEYCCSILLILKIQRMKIFKTVIVPVFQSLKTYVVFFYSFCFSDDKQFYLHYPIPIVSCGYTEECEESHSKVAKCCMPP